MKQKTSLYQALQASPGPNNLLGGIILFFKGLIMGIADVIPGVSGGTIALITGIYTQLLDAIKSFDLISLKLLLSLRFVEALTRVHLRFLLCLLSGIAVAIVSLASLMHHLITHYPVPTWSLFFGLIAASILLLGKQVEGWLGKAGLLFLIGATSGWALTGLIPTQTPQTPLFFFLAGMVAICAMILPGISGAFILLVLGKYEAVTSALKNPIDPTNLLIILVFCLGCLVGILAFSRLLSYLMHRHQNLALAFLTGLMAGAMRKIWPFKETLETTLIRGKVHVLQEANILPAWDIELWFPLALALIGFIAIWALEKATRRS